MTRWGDKVRVRDIRQWYAARHGLVEVVRPAPLSHHCDAQTTELRGGAGRDGTMS